MGKDKGDVSPGSFPGDLNWSEDMAAVSLEKLYQFVNSECGRCINWYFEAKRTKRILGYIFRVCAILAVAISGVIPILGEIYEDGNMPILSPAWATIALAIAGLLLALDRFGGYTTGWIRYIRAGMALSRLQSNFRVEWEAQKLIWQGGQANSDAVKQAIQRCRDFLDQVNLIVSAETDEWAQDFMKVLVELEKKGKDE
jgi:hypothetical protein